MEETPKTSLESLPSEWLNAPSGNFYIFNGSYASIIIANEQVINKEQNPEIIEKYKNQFLKSCYQFFNKKIPDTKIEVKLQDNYIDPYPNMGEKLLFTIPFTTIDGLADNPNNDSEYQNEATYELADYSTKVNFVASEFLKYQGAYLQDLFDQKTIGYENLDFQLESESLISFNNNLNKLAQVNEVDLSNFTTIKFSFDGLNIKRIILENELGKKELAVSFSYFANSSPQDREETNYFILNLNTLFRNCKNTSKTYGDVVGENFLHSKKKLTSYSDPVNRSLKNSNTYGITNDDVNNKFASSQEISKKFVKEFQNIAKRSVYQTPCLTAEEKERKDKELKDGQRKQKGFLGELSYNIGDTFVDNLPQILQKVGDKKGKDAANALGTEVLNRLGVCGLGDIVAMVANTATSFLDPEEYNEEIAKCALERLSDDELETFAAELSRFDNNGPKILQRYRSLIGDSALLPPWKTAGYSAPNKFTGDSFSERYKINFTNPLDKENDIETDVLFSAYRDAIRLEVNTESILSSLTSAFPDEMGWLSFFTDVTKIMLQKCSGISGKNPSLNLSANLCKEKNFKLPRIPRIPSGGATPTSVIANQLIEEMKNIIINLIVKLITSTMQQLFQVIAAGVSFDQNYFKRGDYIPDLFQNENYMHDNFKKQASNKKRTNSEINNSVRTMLLESIPPTDEELSLEEVDRLLKQISISIGEYEKIKLFKGEASSQAYEKVRFLAKNMGLGKFFRNDIDVEKFFLEMGKRLNVARMEKDYFDSIYDYDPWVSFCILDSDMLDRAYFKNKDGITQDQVDTMKEKLKDIQKDKLCSLAETMGNSSGPILGEISKLLTDKNSQLFNKIKNQEAEYLLDALKGTRKAIAGLYSGDLYKLKGVFDISMDKLELFPIGIIGYNYSRLIPLPSGSISKKPVTTEIMGKGYGDFFNFSKPKKEIINQSIENELFYLPPGEVDQITSYFDSSILNALPKNYFDYIQLNLKPFNKSSWKKGPYNKLSTIENVERFISLSDEKIKKIYNNIEDFKIPDARSVPFNLLKSKPELVQKYIYYSSLITVLYTEMIFKSLNMYGSFKLETSLTKLAARDYINNYIEDNKEKFPQIKQIKDNLVQILFSLPFQEKHAERLSKLAVDLNESIETWLGGDFNSLTDFYSANNSIVEDAFNIFLEIILEEYDQETLNIIFEDNEIENLKTLLDLSFVDRSGNRALKDIITNNEISKGEIDYLTSPSFRKEKFYFVGTPTIEGYPSNVVSLQELRGFIEANSDLAGKKITDFWPSGWNPGIRISSMSTWEHSVISDFLEPLSAKDKDDRQVIIIPLVSYIGDPTIEIIPDNNVLKYPQDISMKEALIDSEEFKKFYSSMNIDELLSYYTNYYIEKADDRIKSFGIEEFFNKTKETLLELE